MNIISERIFRLGISVEFEHDCLFCWFVCTKYNVCNPFEDNDLTPNDMVHIMNQMTCTKQYGPYHMAHMIWLMIIYAIAI